MTEKQQNASFALAAWIIFTIGTTIAFGFGGFLIGVSFPFILEECMKAARPGPK